MQSLQEFANGLSFGEEVRFENLTMVPVLTGAAPAEPGYLLLSEAVEAKLARVTELGGGVVPELLFENLADCPVLILGGEELAGAKQNRMVNLTILAAPRSKIVIPVSCVEAGRWHTVTREFSPSPFMAFSTMRGRSVLRVTASMRMAQCRRADQGEVWSAIAERSEELGARSSTGAMRAIFEQRLSDIEEFVRAMAWQEGQIGAAFLIDGAPAGLDVFDHPRTMEKWMAKLVRGYAVDALAQQRSRRAREAAGEPAQTTPENGISAKDKLRRWLETAGTGEMLVEPAVGMGQDVRLENEKLTAAALWAEERFVHFCAFPQNGGLQWRGRRAPDRLNRDIWRRRPRRSRGDA